MVRAIENVVVIICFTILAIHFESFWMVLCSVFMMKAADIKGGGRNEQK